MAKNNLAERLARLAGSVPDAAQVIALPEAAEVRELGVALAQSLGAALGWKISEKQVDMRKSATVLRDPDRGRVTVFHASGAVSLRSTVAPFDELFAKDPGDVSLTERLRDQVRHLAVEDLLAPAERLDFERLWRLRAAGSDPAGRVTEPVLCRAIGAFRHQVHGLRVLGRASVHLELTGKGQVSAASVSMRRPTDGGSKVLAEVQIRDPLDAAAEVASRVAKMIGGGDPGDEVKAEAFSFGYLSLGRRRPQSLLAPFYIASVSIDGGPGRTKSAHLVPVPASQERFLSIPRGAAAVSLERKPGLSPVAN